MDDKENKKDEIKEEKNETKNNEAENNIESSKSRFYKKFIWSVGKISKIPEMTKEGLKSAVKYFFIVIAIYAIILGIVETYLNIKLVDDVAQYLNTDLPEFVYVNNELSLEDNDSIIIDNSDFIKLFGFKVVVNTNLEKEEAINEYYELATENSPCVVIMQDEYILITSDYEPEEETVDTENQEENDDQIEEDQEDDPTGISTYSYEDFTTNNALDEETEYNKQSLINYLESQNSGIANYFVYFFIVYFGILTITFLFQIIIITLTAFVVSKVLKKNITFKELFIITTYASTLAFTLYVLHSIISYFASFSIPYIYVIILIIAYLYVLFTMDKMKAENDINI